MWGLYSITPIRAIGLALLVVLMLALPLGIFLTYFSMNSFCSSLRADLSNENFMGSPIPEPAPPNCYGERVESTLRRLATLSAVAATGAFGAAVGYATRQSTRTTPSNTAPAHKDHGTEASVSTQREIDLRGTLIELLVIQFVGSAFAIALSFVFFGGLVGGSLFPTQGPLKIMTNGNEGEFFKLQTWSFIAGFSQQTVPGFLANLIKRAKAEQNKEQADDLPSP